MQSCGSAQAQAQRAQKEYPKPMSIAALGGLSKFVLPKPIALGASLELPKPHAMLRGDTVRAARRLSVGTSAMRPWRSSKCRLMLHFVRSMLYCTMHFVRFMYVARCIVRCKLYAACGTFHRAVRPAGGARILRRLPQAAAAQAAAVEAEPLCAGRAGLPVCPFCPACAPLCQAC